MIRALFLLLFTTTLQAVEPTPRERILRLVPEETSVCFVVQNLRERATTVAASPFAAWATEKLTPTLEGNAEAKSLKNVEMFFQAILGVTLQDIRDDILGDCVAFAYQPGSSGHEERGVVLLYTRDQKKFATLIEKVNSLQIQQKELVEVSERKHGNAVYYKRDHGDTAAEYYLLQGNLFAFSKQEDAIKTIVDRAAKPQDSQVLKDLNALKLQDTFLACWLNPRKLEAELVAPAGASASEKAGIEQVAKLWRAVDQCAIYLKADSGLELGASIAYRTKDLPMEWQAILGKAPTASPLWAAVPANAMLAIVGDLEANAFLNVVESFLPAAEKPKFRKQIEKEIGSIIGSKQVQPLLDGLGPEFGLWLSPTPKGGPALPMAMLVAQSKSDDTKQVLEFYSQMLRYDYNRHHEDQIERTTSGEIATLTNAALFPRGVTPSYAAMNGYAFFASEPGPIGSFRTPVAKREATPEVPLARIAAKVLREQLTNHAVELPKLLAKWQDRDADEIKKELETLVKVLEAFERVELVVRGDERSRTFALKVELIKPLK